MIGYARKALCVLAVLVAGSATIARADILVPDGLNPGDEYQFIFVTSETFHPASSTDINYYNDIVTAAAAGADALTKDWGLTWTVVGSTETKDAYVNAPVLAPVYRLDGLKVAADSNQFYGNVATGLSGTLTVTEKGTVTGGSALTGSDKFGVAKQNDLQLGPGTTEVGNVTNLTTFLDSGVSDKDGFYHYYALSNVIIVPVPEPSTITLWLCVAGLGLFVGVRRRKGGGQAS